MPTTDYRPTLDRIAAVLRAYTRTEYGADAPTETFTADTTPTATQVEEIVAQTLPLVAARLGADVATPLLDAARSIAALRAAMAVVLSSMREGDGQQREVYELLREEYRDAIADFTAAASHNDATSGGKGGGIGSIAVRTVYTP